MTDRELLELAAKAAGLNVRWNPTFCKGMGQWERDVRPVDSPFSEWLSWNPLTDDGDALRLAVAVGMVVNTTEIVSSASVSRAICCVEIHGDDPCAATRRAIVRAAAEIGRAALAQEQEEV